MAHLNNYGTYEEYVRINNETVKKSYKETHKSTNIGLYITSWFGNAMSIFLAYFYLKSLFDSAYADVSGSFVITFLILFFLTMFELLKRHMITLFSKEIIRQKFNYFNKALLGSYISLFVLIGGSFYLSLSGAGKFMNMDTIIERTFERNVTVNSDSINTFYFNNYIKPLLDENKSLNTQNNEYLSVSQKMYAGKYTSLIEQNNTKIKDNNDKISKYEKERDDKLLSIKDKENNKLNKSKSTNNFNLIVFIIISSLIETAIIIGVYFHIHYLFKIKDEYEQYVLNQPSYRKWLLYTKLVNVCFEGLMVGSDLPSATEIKDLVDMNDMQVSPRELENFFKMMYYLKVIERHGSKRVLNLTIAEAQELIKNYYKIV